MIRVDVSQGSPEWEFIRLGMPTASQFKRILTPKKLALSADAASYRNELLAEWLCGYKPVFGSRGNSTGYADRGTDMEAQARRVYEFTHDVEVELVGFVMRDDGRVGGSPDGFVSDEGGADFKCPAMHTHIGYMLEPASLADDYRSQCQGYMYLSGREWWDLFSFHPMLPPVEQRIIRDDKYQEALGVALDSFVSDLQAARHRLAEFRSEFAIRREQNARIATIKDGDTQVIDIMQLLKRSVEAARA